MKRPQFTLRDLMWLTVVVGLVAGWWVDRRASAQNVERLLGDIDRLRSVNGWAFAEIEDLKGLLGKRAND